MPEQLEDEFGDIIGKARRGQQLDVQAVAAQTGLSAAAIERLERYELRPDEAAVARLAQCLGLHPDKLQAAAAAAFFPAQPGGGSFEAIDVEMLELGRDFHSNGYLVGCRKTHRGAVIDPGADAETILKAIETAALEIEAILMTHGHHDHVGALGEIVEATGAPAFIHRADMGLIGPLATRIEGTLVDGETISVGGQELIARALPGHTPGGVGLVHPEAAFTGDALFAGSLGGTRRRRDYASQRDAVRQHLLGLEPGVTLFPGHGPATTVAEERASNPFFD